MNAGTMKSTVTFIPVTEASLERRQAALEKLLEATIHTALAMKAVFQCDGVSTRQHNEPAGYQDVWHFHVHVFPRFHGDSLYTSEKMEYTDEEREQVTMILAQEVERIRSGNRAERP